MVGFSHEFDSWIEPLPSHGASIIEHRFHRIEERSIPMVFQDPPASFDRIVLAMIRRIVGETNMELRLLNEINHTLHKLSATAVVFRPIIEIDD